MLSLHGSRPQTATVISISYLGQIPVPPARSQLRPVASRTVSALSVPGPLTPSRLEPEVKLASELLLACAGVDSQLLPRGTAGPEASGLLRSLRRSFALRSVGAVSAGAGIGWPRRHARC